MAAVINWRLPEPASVDVGPLPWLPGLPKTLQDHHLGAGIQGAVVQLVVDLANEVFEAAPAIAANSPYGALSGSHPTAAPWWRLSGVPLSVSIPKTADQPEQDTYSGVHFLATEPAIEPLPYAAAA